MSNYGSNPSGKGWQGTMATSPSVGRFEKEPATMFIKGSSPRLSDNNGRKNIATYSNHGHLHLQSLSREQQQPSPGFVGLRTAPTLRERGASWGAHDQPAAREVSEPETANGR